GRGFSLPPLCQISAVVNLTQPQSTIHIGSLRPSHGLAGPIGPHDIAPEFFPNCNCRSMLSRGPRHRRESYEDASLGPPQWTWQSLAALRNKFSACLVLPVRR